jgi:hypothetical protein
MHVIIQKVLRQVVLSLLFFLPKERKIAIERWLRGRDEFNKLSNADCVIVSFGKSGRTWLRVMISRFYQVKHGLSKKHMINFDNLHRKNNNIPKIFFTHDNYIKDYTKNKDSKADFYDKKVVLLIRDPRDVAVSQFFQWKYRMRPAKKKINNYPMHDEDVSVFDFVMNSDAGLPKIIDFMNLWATETPRLKHMLVVRYEDMRADTEAQLKRIVDFIGTPGSVDQIKEAVSFASYENMKKMEQKRVFWLSGSRMVPKDRTNPNSYKVRRAKVGGYKDYFDDHEVAEIDGLADSRLSSVFGYETKREADKIAVH